MAEKRNSTKEDITARLIDNVRAYYQITQEQLSSGLCDPSMLSQMIAGRKHFVLDKLLIDALLQRAGRSMRMFEYLMEPEEYRLYERRQEIRDCIDTAVHAKGEKKKAELTKMRKLIKEYQNVTQKEHKLHIQFALLMETYLLYLEGADVAEQYRVTKEALEVTILQIERKNWTELYYSETELTLAVRLAFLYAKLGEKALAISRHEQLYSLLKRTCYLDGLQIDILAPVFYRLAKYYFEAGDDESAYKISSECVKLLCRNNKFYYVTELMLLEEKALARMRYGKIPSEEVLRESVKYRRYLVLRDFLDEFCANWNADTNYPIYREYGVVPLGEVILQRRKLLGLTQEELVWTEEGQICSVDTLSRLENGKCKTQWKNTSRLLQRLNLPVDKLCYDVITSDYKVMLEMQQIELLSEQKKVSEAITRLHNLQKEKQYVDCITSRQGMEFLEYILKCKKNAVSKEERFQKCRSLLEHSIPWDKIGQIESCYLFSNEMRLVRNIAQILFVIGKQDEAFILLHKLEHCFDLFLKGSAGLEYKKIGILYALENHLENTGQLEKADRVLSQCLELGVRYNAMGLMGCLLYDKAWEMEQKQGKDLKKGQYRRYVCIAYVFDLLRHYNTHIETIEQHCNRYYPGESIIENLK